MAILFPALSVMLVRLPTLVIRQHVGVIALRRDFHDLVGAAKGIQLVRLLDR